MGIWTTFTGKITTHQSDNFSVKKALEAYYDGHDFTVSIFKCFLNIIRNKINILKQMLMLKGGFYASGRTL